MSTPTTRRYPRTLQEAFGPYTSTVIHEGERPSLGYRVACKLSIAAGLLCLLIF